MSSIPEAIFFLDRAKPTGLQAQIRETLVSGILSGRLVPAANLPSTRKLADYLGVSRITVTLAYQELASQGYIEASPRSGYRVCNSAPIARLRASDLLPGGDGLDWESRLRRRYSLAKRISKPLEWRRFPYPFLYGQMDM